MNTGKTLFAQLMDFLPWSTFDRIVARYNGNRAVRTLPCAAQYQVMALCCTNIVPVAACQLVEASTDPDGGWHTEACHPVQHVASNLCFDLLTGQIRARSRRPMMVLYRYIAVSTRLRRL